MIVNYGKKLINKWRLEESVKSLEVWMYRIIVISALIALSMGSLGYIREKSLKTQNKTTIVKRPSTPLLQKGETICGKTHKLGEIIDGLRCSYITNYDLDDFNN